MKNLYLLLLFCCLGGIAGAQTLFFETFDDTGTSGTSAEGIAWSCTPFCNTTTGVFSSNGTELYCNNPKEIVTWSTGNIDVSGWYEVQLVVNFSVSGDMEGACNIGSSCECSDIPNTTTAPCPPVSSFDFLTIGYSLDGSPYAVPNQLGCGDIICSPSCGAPPKSSCDVSNGGGYTYYGDCLNGNIDDLDMNNGTGTVSFNLIWTINMLQAVNNLALEFSMRTNATDEVFSIQDVTVIGVVLPVEMTAFEAYGLSGKTQLRWSTASETGNAYFMVEHSADGREFTAIARVDGAGTTRDPREYTFIDAQPLSGINYYRLRQVNLDGRSGYSPVRSVVFGQENVFRIYPSPVSDALQLQWRGPLDTGFSWEIFDLAGRRLLEGGGYAGETGLSIPVHALPGGHFLFRLTDSRNSWAQHFVKQ